MMDVVTSERATAMIQTLKKPKSSEDQITVYHDRTWEQFKHIQKGLEGTPGVPSNPF